MRNVIEKMLSDYDFGLLDRRALIAGLVSMFVAESGAAGSVAQAEPPSTFTAVGLNHIALNVPDVGRSRDFYLRHLGLEITRETSNSCFLSFGDNFLALFRSSEAGMNHYCFSIKNYEVEEVARKLKTQNLQPRIEGNRIYFNDPDGLTVQLSAPEHRA